jgi:predicted nicotinamide N-methyase
MLVDADGFIRAHTSPVRLEFVPEIQLYVAGEIVPLWQAVEWRMASPQPPPFWAFAWPGSQALARYILDAPHTVRGARVLDYGAGSGLAAIAASMCGARQIVACDVDPLAAVAQGLNAALNGENVVSVTGDCAESGSDADVVLAGDVCYEREPAERTLEWLRARARKGTEVFIADPGRHYAPSDGLELLAEYQVPVLRDLESTDSKRTRLWRLLP